LNTANNQDGALAQWRADAAKNDPPFYSVQHRHGRPFVWMNVGGNVGWYAPEVKAGEVVGFRGESWPQPSEDEAEEDRAALNYAFKLINPKQRRKLAHLLAV